MQQTLRPPPTDIRLSEHAFFLDFDGTLTPIVDRPEDVLLAEDTASLLHRLHTACDGGVAIVTGRALSGVRPYLGDLPLVVSGSHGHELHWPGTKAADPEGAEELSSAHETLLAFAEARGLKIERKPGAVAVHYRNAAHHGPDTRAAVDAAVAGDPALRSIHGNMVSEAALVRSDKGSAIRDLLNHAPFRHKTPIMVGDDVTDEDGFRAASACGGFGLRIGAGTTEAIYQVETMEEFLDWLGVLLNTSD